MYVPVITATRRGNVVNKTVVYSDTVLPIKEKGSNIVVTSINDVNEYSLDSCLTTIFESNPDVTFNTIQYSKNDKTVYFYTDKGISLQSYRESKVFKYKPIISTTEILEEIKNVFNSLGNKNEDCVSLDLVLNLIKYKGRKFGKIGVTYQRRLEAIMNNYYHDVGLIVYGYDYEKRNLRIGYRYLSEYEEILFGKRNDDLIIIKSESLHANDVLACIGNELSKLCDLYEEYREFNEQHNYGFRAVNSNFLINLNSYEISIFVSNDNCIFSKDFELTVYCYDRYDSIQYGYECNSNNVLNLIRGHEDDLFKRIYVKINDCPKWSHESLYELRKNQLEEDQILEDEIKYREMKKQKRLALKRKLFPFLKK